MTAPFKHRWYQFSLRTLLLLMTGVAACVGLFTARWNNAHRQAAFVSDLGPFDEAHYDYEVFMDGRPNYPEKFPWDAKSPYPQFLHQWLSKDFFHTVVSIKLWDPSHSEKERNRTLELIRSDLPGLRQLTINDNTTADDLEQIVGIMSLRSLAISSGGVENKDLPILSRATQLENLNLELSNRSLSDEELRPLMCLTNLRSLSIRDTWPAESPKSLAGPWLAAFPRLEEFDANGVPLDGRAAEHLATLTNLKDVCLAKTRMDDGALVHLGKLVHLEELDLSETRITDAGLKHLSPLTNLKRLRLDRTAITGSSLSFLAGMTHLETLDLNETEIGSDGMQSLGKLPNLRSLSLCKTHFGDAGLRRLGEFPKLQILRLQGTDVSDHVWEQLTWPPELCHLHLQETCVTQAALKNLLNCPTLRYLAVEESQFDVQDVLAFQLAKPNGSMTLGYPNRSGRRESQPIGDY